MIESVGVNRTCLVATDKSNRNAMLSARNVANVDVCRIDQLNVFALLNHRFLVVDKAALVAFLNETCFEAAAADAPAVESKPAKAPKAKKEAK
jgi:ribosomal protein L4